MSIFIYDSLTRKKEEFIPCQDKQINMYTCGVTVYDECHIGHARSLYIFEVIRRYLEFSGYKVKLVRNITDIDDKIIQRAQALKIDWQELVQRYIESYQKDLSLFNIRPADFEPCATQHIPEMILNIEILFKKGYAYATESGVYFRVNKFMDYGKLSGQKTEQMLNGVRIEPDEKKEYPLDFALWKFSKSGEPYWESPWGKGRPGWHIECSTLARQYLGDTLDIHGGGRDLIFPHHENEIAQSEAITDKPFSKYWIHHGLLTIQGQKMAKSLGNFVSIKDVLKDYSADTLKLFFLFTHYAHPADFSWEKLKEADKARMRFVNLAERLSCLGVLKQSIEPRDFPEIVALKEEFILAMNDDFNTAKALAVLFKIVNTIDADLLYYKGNIKKIIYAKNILEELIRIFGLSFEIEEIDRDIMEKIKLRERLRKEKNFLAADEIRKSLKEAGIILEDTPQGTIYRRQ